MTGPEKMWLVYHLKILIIFIIIPACVGVVMGILGYENDTVLLLGGGCVIASVGVGIGIAFWDGDL